MTTFEYLEATALLRRKCFPDPPDWRFSSIEELVLYYGYAYTRVALPDKAPRGPARECFANSLRWASKDDSVVYVEGYAHGSHLTTLHAWTTPRFGARREAYDPTWPEGSDYLGIAFDTAWVVANAVRTGVWGVFGGLDPDLLGRFLRNGIPSEALFAGDTAL